MIDFASVARSTRILPVAIMCVSLIAIAACNNSNLDTDSATRLQELKKEFATGKRLRGESFDELRALYEKHPDSTAVSDFYRDAMIVRGDWLSLQEFYKNKDAAGLSELDQRNLAKVLIKVGNFRRSLEVLEPLIQKKPDDPELKGLAASAKFSLGELDDAAKLLDSAWTTILKAKMVDEITLRGIIFIRQGDFEKAAETLETAFEFQPRSISVNYNLSRAYSRLGKNEKAAEHLERASAGQKALKADTYEQSVNVKRIYQLEAAWKTRDFKKVIELSNKLLDSTDDKSRKLTLYQYLFKSYQALGNKDKAKEVRVQAQALAEK